MKTIELLINGQPAQFTTKSVTIEGKEYFYSKITQLDHSPIVLTYKMECDGEEKLLRYEKKDAKVLTVIFSQVHKMIELKKAKAAEKPAAETPAKVEKHVKAEEPAKVEPVKAEQPADAEAPAAAEETASANVKEPAKTETAGTSDDMDEMVKATIALNEERAKKEAEKAEKKARKKAIKEAKKNGTPIPEEFTKKDGKEAGSEEALPVDPEKKAKLKKSLAIFGIVIAVIIALSVIYYFVFGTSNAPTDAGPGVTESQQYEDIDQLIEDLQ